MACAGPARGEPSAAPMSSTEKSSARPIKRKHRFEPLFTPLAWWFYCFLVEPAKRRDETCTAQAAARGLPKLLFLIWSLSCRLCYAGCRVRSPTTWRKEYLMVGSLPKLWLLGSIGAAVLPLSVAANDGYSELWKHLEDSRQQLETGVFRASGREVEMSLRGQVENDVEIFCAFDTPENRLRFDRTSTSAGNNAATTATVRWYRTRSESAFKTDGRAEVSIRPPDERAPRDVKPFDIRALGLAYQDGLQKFVPFEDAYRAYSAALASPTITTEADDIFVLHWVLEGNYMQRTVWVNAREGFTPFRLELAYTKGRPLDTVAVSYRADIAYTEFEGVWVPTSLSAVDHPDNASQLPWSLDLAFEWEAVNREIPNALFTEQGLGARAGDRIIDFRLGAPIHARTIPATGAYGGYAVSRRSLLIAANVLAVLLTLLIVLLRRLKKRRLNPR